MYIHPYPRLRRRRWKLVSGWKAWRWSREGDSTVSVPALVLVLPYSSAKCNEGALFDKDPSICAKGRSVFLFVSHKGGSFWAHSICNTGPATEPGSAHGSQKKKKSLWTLADCEWRAADPGLKPLRLSRAPHTTPTHATVRLLVFGLYAATQLATHLRPKNLFESRVFESRVCFFLFSAPPHPLT